MKCESCKEVEIPEPEYCCSGYMCGCMGLPVYPPVCKECWDESLLIVNPLRRSRVSEMDDVEQRYDNLFDEWIAEENEKPEFSKQDEVEE